MAVAPYKIHRVEDLWRDRRDRNTEELATQIMNEEMSPKDHQEPPQQPGNQDNQSSNSNATATVTEEDLLEAENDLQGE